MPKKTKLKKFTAKSKKISQKPLTLNGLIKYNQEVLFPMLDNKFSKIDNRLAKADDRFAKIDDRFDKIDNRFAIIDNRFAIIDNRFAKIDDRFDKIEGEIQEKFDKVLTGQDKILKIIEDLRSDNTASLESEKRQEEKLENHEMRIKIIEQKAGMAAVK